MDGGAWWAAVHGVAKSRTRLSDFTFTFHIHALEKEMAIHSSVLAWRIPGMAEPGGLPSMGWHRVGHDWSDLAAAAALFTYSVWSLANPYYFLSNNLTVIKIMQFNLIVQHLEQYNSWHTVAHSHLWMFPTWRIICKGLTIQVGDVYYR